MRCVILSPVACPTPPYFSTLFHKWHDFLKKLLCIRCVLIFSTLLSETFLILRGIQWAIINVHWTSCIVSIGLVRF